MLIHVILVLVVAGVLLWLVESFIPMDAKILRLLQALLVTPSAVAETAQLFVRDSVIYRGSTVTTSGQAAPLFLGYTGASPLTIESPFKGTIVAPRAQLNLQSLNGTGVYSGEFFANQVVLSPHTAVNSDPFTCTATCIVGCQ